MTIQPGDKFKSAATMTDSNFMDSKIIITTVDDTGCMGFVYNKIFSRPLNELEEFKHAAAIPLYTGGPVDQEHLFFVHQRPDLVSGSDEISGGLVLGGDFKQAVDCLNSGRISNADIKIFIGYSGWDLGELESEIAEGSWVKIEEPVNSIF